ncbi:pilin, partial [Patescibacteria group bacterium]|nr:pilin [Patescibacteria group bacterium]
MKKTIPILILCIFLLIGFSQTSHAIELLIKEYPTVGGEKLGEQSSIPGLIKYIYLFALGIVGFVALLSIVIGAFQYTTSAGNPTKAGEAKERIMSALLGVLILLSAVLILNTINPDLTSFEIELQKIGQTNNTPNEENDYSG